MFGGSDGKEFYSEIAHHPVLQNQRQLRGISEVPAQKAFLTEHAEEIEKHEAVKRAFEALQGKAIPKVAALSEEYYKLLTEKQIEYEKYKAARQDMITYQAVKQNVDIILGLHTSTQERKNATEEQR